MFLPSFLPSQNKLLWQAWQGNVLHIFFIVWQVFDGCQFCLMEFFSPLYSPLKVLVSLWVKLPPAFLRTLDILAISFLFLFPLASISLHSCHSLMDNTQLFEAASCDLGAHPGCVVDLLVGPCRMSCAAAQHRCWVWQGCCALGAMGTTLSVQVRHVQDSSEADSENSWCLIDAWEACLPALVRCNWFGHLLWIPHLS